MDELARKKQRARYLMATHFSGVEFELNDAGWPTIDCAENLEYGGDMSVFDARDELVQLLATIGAN